MADGELLPWRKNLHTFAEHLSGGEWLPYPHLVYLADKLSTDLDGRRLIVNMPPQHGKSSLISHWLPVRYLEAFPERWVILTSYEATYAADWGRKVRDTFQRSDTWTTVRQDARAANKFLTPEGGGMVTAGVGGPITGRSGNLIIIDDPYKNWQQANSPTYRKHLIEWFESTLYTRQATDTAIIVVQTRWHQADLSGWLVREHSDSWEVISLPALAEAGDPLDRADGQPLCPERFSLEQLLRIKQGVGSRVWAGMYQQRPMPAEGSVIKLEWLKFWDELPALDVVVQSWDMAFKDLATSSYVVGQAWGRAGGNFYLGPHQVRDRLDFVRSLKAVAAYSERHPEARRKLVEDKANGPAIISVLKEQIPGLIAVSPRGSKEARLQAVAPLFESGNVHLPHPKHYPWVNDYIDELTTFPSSANDDQVDATSQALADLSGRRARPTGNITLPDFSRANPWSV